MLTPQMIEQANKITGWNVPTTGRNNPPVKSRAQEIEEIANKSLADRASREQSRLESTSAESNSAIFPAKTGEGPLAAGAKATGNVASSAFNLGKNVAKAVAHPINTAKGIFQTVKGSGEALGRKLVEKTKFGNIVASNGKTLKENAKELAPDMSEETFNNLVDSLHDRYGSLENAQRTATNDPFGFGADVMAVLSGGAGIARKIAPEATASIATKLDKVTAPISEANKTARGKVAGALQKSAQGNIEKVLNPTKEAMKVQTQQILPKLTERNKIAFTNKGLSEKYAGEMEASGQAIDEAWQQLPAGSREKITPIVDALEQSKNKFVVDGTIVEPNAWKAADELQKIIIDVSKGEDTIPSQSLRRVRQIWDDSIAKSKGFTKDLSEQDKLAIKREATDAIRKELSKSHPNIDALNKEYTLWRKAHDIIEETIKRKTGNGVPIDNKMLAGFGGVAGSAKAGIKGAAIGAGIVTALTVASKSTLWRTLSAALKNRLAKAIFEAKPVEIKRILAPLIGDQAIGEIEKASE